MTLNCSVLSMTLNCSSLSWVWRFVLSRTANCFVLSMTLNCFVLSMTLNCFVLSMTLNYLSLLQLQLLVHHLVLRHHLGTLPPKEAGISTLHRNTTKNSMTHPITHHNHIPQYTILSISQVHTTHLTDLQHTTLACSTHCSSSAHLTAMHHTSWPRDTPHSNTSPQGSAPHNMGTIHLALHIIPHGHTSLHISTPHIRGTSHHTALQHTSQEHSVLQPRSTLQEFVTPYSTTRLLVLSMTWNCCPEYDLKLLPTLYTEH